ncbi:MAG: hypothetical protein ACI9WC_003010 [Arenicella sp.]|jgi:hypothetical protein
MNYERIKLLSERKFNLETKFNANREAIAVLQAENVVITKTIIDTNVKLQVERICEDCES